MGAIKIEMIYNITYIFLEKLIIQMTCTLFSSFDKDVGAGLKPALFESISASEWAGFKPAPTSPENKITIPWT